MAVIGAQHLDGYTAVAAGYSNVGFSLARIYREAVCKADKLVCRNGVGERSAPKGRCQARNHSIVILQRMFAIG